jgi:4-amino-4-deoxy-L-arabinose transferase-like glycosyltransferase
MLAKVSRRGFDRGDALCLGVLVAGGLLLLAPGLAHPGIHNWDEALHQAAARGTYDSFFYPHVYSHHLYPHPLANWWEPEAWVHKPPAPFWFAAIVMHIVGVTPWALRLASLLGELGAAVCGYLLVRSLTGRVRATFVMLGFLALPFGWQLVSGVLFGDATDVTLMAWVSFAMLLLWWSVEQDSWQWAAAAGAATGVAYLCKYALALPPLGVAAAMTLLRLVGWSKGPRLRALLAMALAAVLVALPWNLYAAHSWPQAYRQVMGFVFSHFRKDAAYDVGPWDRPLDAVFVELMGDEFGPLPTILPPLAAAWLLARALRRRETATTVAALWVWSTWIIISLGRTKVPALIWGTAPGVFGALAILWTDAWRSETAAVSFLAAIASPTLMKLMSWLGRVRQWLPNALEQTRRVPGTAEGAVLVVAAIFVGLILSRFRRRLPWLPALLGLAVTAVIAWQLVWVFPRALSERQLQHSQELWSSYTRDVGRALDAVSPPKSVSFLDIDTQPPWQFEVQDMLFWSGRPTYIRAPDPATAHAQGYHPYLVSPAAEPFAALAVPPESWFRLYDLDSASPPPALPEGIHTLDVQAGGMHVLGWASTPLRGGHDGVDQYAFYVHSDGVPGALPVRFQTDSGETSIVLQPEASLRARHRLAGVPWFILPTLGPPARGLQAFVLGTSRVELGPRP